MPDLSPMYIWKTQIDSFPGQMGLRHLSLPGYVAPGQNGPGHWLVLLYHALYALAIEHVWILSQTQTIAC